MGSTRGYSEDTMHVADVHAQSCSAEGVGIRSAAFRKGQVPGRYVQRRPCRAPDPCLWEAIGDLEGLVTHCKRAWRWREKHFMKYGLAPEELNTYCDREDICNGLAAFEREGLRNFTLVGPEPEEQWAALDKPLECRFDPWSSAGLAAGLPHSEHSARGGRWPYHVEEQLRLRRACAMDAHPSDNHGGDRSGGTGMHPGSLRAGRNFCAAWEACDVLATPMARARVHYWR